MLRHQLVCAINDNYIQPRLLSKPRLDFKKAMELALGLETAVKNALELQSSGREFASTETTTHLHTYSGGQLMILGHLDVEVQYGAQEAHLPLFVVQEVGSSLLVQDWLQHLFLIGQASVKSKVENHQL